ncbi:unnamed protein product, partial [marine sediment metagenome]
AETVEGTKPLALNWLSYNEGLALAEKENIFIFISNLFCLYLTLFFIALLILYNFNFQRQLFFT